MTVVSAGTYSSTHTRIVRTEILLRFTMFPHPAGLTVAFVIIDELATICSSIFITGFRQTFVDISLTT
jgi:hypothetical protein